MKTEEKKEKHTAEKNVILHNITSGKAGDVGRLGEK